MGLWSGPEFDSFTSVKAAWERDTGATVDWTGARDLARELLAQIDAGDAPDIAILPNPGLLHELAAKGQLVPLGPVLGEDQVRKDYSAPWLDLGSHDGALYGIPYKVTNKATVWYAPKAFAAAGYQVPSTWDEMLALADTMVAEGRTPFSVVAPRTPGGGGWALTDWVSQLVLTTCGSDLYDQWTAGTVPWTDPCITRSFEQFDAVIHRPGYVLGGSERVVATGDAEGAYPLYSDPPTAYMYYLASFAQAFIATKYPSLSPGSDYDFFRFPAAQAGDPRSFTIGADIVVMLRDTPTARSLMRYLAGAPAQEAWIERGGFVSVNRKVALTAYPDPVARRAAEELTSAAVIRFSAGDLVPSPLQRAWWKAMLDLVNANGSLDTALASLSDPALRASR